MLRGQSNTLSSQQFARQPAPSHNNSVIAEPGATRDGRTQSVQLHFSGNSTLEGAMNWLEEHGDDKDLDELLLVEKKDAVRPLCNSSISALNL